MTDTVQHRQGRPRTNGGGLDGLGRRPSSKRLLAKDAARVVKAARKTRSDLMGVIRLVGRRQREALGIDETGNEFVSWERLTPKERIGDLQTALRWLQESENSLRQTRILLERAIERAERATL